MNYVDFKGGRPYVTYRCSTTQFPLVFGLSDRYLYLVTD